MSVLTIGCATAGDKPSRGFQTLDTRVGELTFENSFENGVPTAETADLLFNESDFQRATQAYIWAIPIVSFYEWMNGHHDVWETEQGQLVFQATYRQKLGGLTYNTATPYLIGFLSLDAGPVVIEIPSEDLRGAVHNMWQIGKGQMTKPGKYVVHKAAEDPPELEGATAIAMDTNDFFIGLRLMSPDAEVRKQCIAQIQESLTDLEGRRLTERATFLVDVGIDHKQPRGLKY